MPAFVSTFASGNTNINCFTVAIINHSVDLQLIPTNIFFLILRLIIVVKYLTLERKIHYCVLKSFLSSLLWAQSQPSLHDEAPPPATLLHSLQLPH